MNLTLRRRAATALLSTALVMAAVTTAAGSASAVTPGPTHISSAFSHDLTSVTIAKGESITAYGHLQDAYYRDLAGYVISLWARTDSSKPWTNLRSIVTDAGGKAWQKVTPNYSTQLQWRFAGVAGEDPSVSPVLNLTIGVPPTWISAWDDAAPSFSSLYVVKGQPTQFVGVLRDSQFRYPISGATITLYARGSATKPWTELKTLTTDVSGRVAQTITPNYDVQLRWGWAGSSVHAASFSPVVSLVIGTAPTVISITDSLSVTKGMSTNVAGHLYEWQNSSSLLAGQQLDLYARSLPDSPWVKIKSVTTNSEGKVLQAVTPNYSVDLQWRYAGSSLYGPSTSRVITITVTQAA